MLQRIIFVISLSLCINAYATNAIDYGFVPDDPGFDNSVILDEFLSDPSGCHSLHFPHGDFYFLTEPSVIDKALMITGENINNTVLVKSFDNGTLLNSTSTVTIRDLGIVAQDSVGGTAIRLDGLAASSSVLENLYITAKPDASYEIPIIAISSDPLGIRGLLVNNVDVFAATVHLAWFVNVKGANISINGYPAGGTVDHMVIQGYGNHRSASIHFTTRHLVRLWIYGTDRITLHTLGSTTVYDSYSTNVRLY